MTGWFALTPKTRLWFFIIFALLGAGLRLGYVTFYTAGTQLKQFDAGGRDTDIEYLDMAENLKQGHYGLTGDNYLRKAWRPPLYPMVLVAAEKVFGDSRFMAIRVGQSLFSLLVPLCLFFLARRLWDESAGLVAYAWAMVHPHFIMHSASVYNDGLFYVLATIAMTLTVLQTDRKQAFFAGLFMGFACMSRSQFAGAVLIAGLWTLFKPKLDGRVVRAALFTLGYIIIVGPWWVRNYREFNAFVPLSTEGGYTLWLGNNPKASGGGECYLSPCPVNDELDAGKWHYAEAKKYMLEHPARTISLALEKEKRFWAIVPQVGSGKAKLASVVTFFPLFGFGLYGLWLLRKRWLDFAPLLALFGYYFTVQLFFPSVMRYRLAIEPMIIVVAAGAVAEILRRISERRAQV